MVTLRRCVWVTLAVAAAAGLLSVVNVGPIGSPAADAQVAAPGAGGLVARLAVLRRAQTAADMLPPGTHLPGLGATILPALTRLVATLPGDLNVYLVVTTPVGGSLPLWAPRLGDQVTAVAVGQDAAAFIRPFPAADLDDPFNVGAVGNRAPRSPLTGPVHLAIVPDGVSRVRWRFAGPTGGRDHVQTAPVMNNVAIAPQGKEGFLRGATWFAPDGSVVPTSDKVLVRALAARRAVLQARAVRYAEQHSHRAAPSLLAAFAVFSVTSRRPVREPGGITVAWPRLRDVPLDILMLTSHGPGQLDDRQVRAIVTHSGDRMWLIPGAHGLCLAVLDQPLTSSPFSGEGAGGACGTDLSQVEAQGIGLGEGLPGGAGSTYGVLPRSRPSISVKIRGRRRVIRPPFGVYVLHHAGRRHGNGTVIVSPSWR